MKKFVLLLALASSPAYAQQLQLPAPSPAASVSQRVGLTDISVDYSSPGVKGRKIWGDLVPWDKPWRTGANAATKVTFSTDVNFGGKAVPAGSYALLTLPTQKGWTVILNKDLETWPGNHPYDEKKDLVRVPAKTAAIPMRERMIFVFDDTTDASTSLDLEWEKLRVSVPITVDTAAMARANIKKALDGAWRTPANAARYLAEQKDYDAAMKSVDTSLSIESTWLNNWIKADILAKKGDKAQALKFAQTAWDLGQKDQNFYAKDQVQKALADWKKK